MLKPDFLIDKEKRLLQQNAVCTYCNSRNVHFLKMANVSYRINALGQPLFVIKRKVLKPAFTKSAKARVLENIINPRYACITDLYVVCNVCNHTRKIEIVK